MNASCQIDEACGLSVLCPLGEGADLQCEAQAAIVLSCSGFLLLCCALFCSRWVWKMFERPRHGTAKTPQLREVMTSANWHVALKDDPQHTEFNRRQEIMKEIQELGPKADASSKVEELNCLDGRTQVTWDIDYARVDRFLHPKDVTAPEEDVVFTVFGEDCDLSGRRAFTLSAIISATSSEAALMGKVTDPRTIEQPAVEDLLWENAERVGPVKKAAVAKQKVPRPLPTDPLLGERMLTLRAGRLCFEVAVEGGIQRVEGSVQLSDGQRHTVALRSAGPNTPYELLVDGMIDGQGLAGVGIPDVANPSWVLGRMFGCPGGPNWPGVDGPLEGTIEEVRLATALGSQHVMDAADFPIASAHLSSETEAKDALKVHDARIGLFAEGERVEYFSSTHSTWLFGMVQVDREFETTAYNVLMGTTGQLRRDVRPELLRRPLDESEPVWLYVRRYDRWIEAFVFGPQSSSATRLGYRVMPREQVAPDWGATGAPGAPYHGPAFPDVSAAHVARRFDPGSEVEMFVNEQDGWEPAVVVAPDDLEEPPSCSYMDIKAREEQMPYDLVKIERNSETAWVHVCHLRWPPRPDFGHSLSMEMNIEVESNAYSRAASLPASPRGEAAHALDIWNVGDDLRAAAAESPLATDTFGVSTGPALTEVPGKKGPQSWFCSCDDKGMVVAPVTHIEGEEL